MKTLITLLALITVSCGTDQVNETANIPDQSVLEAEEPDVLTIMMCQTGEACDVDGNCTAVLKELEFELDSSLIHWQACYNFEPCDGRPVFTDEQVLNYQNAVCGGS